MIVMNKRYALVEWDEKDSWVTVTWREFADGDDYRGVLDTALDELTRRKCSRLLSDLRSMKVVTPKDQEWVDTDWSLRLRRSPARYSAMVVPKSAIAKLSLQRMANNADRRGLQEVQDGFFTELEEAKRWLRTPQSVRR